MSFKWSPTAGLAAVLATILFPFASTVLAEYPIPPDELLGAGYEVGAFDLLTIDFATGEEYEEGDLDLETNLKGYFDWSQDQGNTDAGFIDPIWIGDEEYDAYVWGNIPTMAARGYVLGTDVLTPFAAEAHRRGLKVVVALEAIAHVLYEMKPHAPELKPISPKDLQQIIRELKALGVDGVSEEAYDDEYIQAIYDISRELGMTYFHYFDDPEGRPDVYTSEDYNLYPLSDEEVERQSEWGTAGSTLGNNSLSFGHARALHKSSMVATAGGWGLQAGMQINVAVFRMIQFDPMGFQYIDADEADKAWIRQHKAGEGVRTLYREFGKTFAPKPKANVISYLPSDPDLYGALYLDEAETRTMDCLINTLDAAGYEIYVTYDHPYPAEDVEAYVLLSLGTYTPFADLAEEVTPPPYHDIGEDLVALFSSGKKVLLVTAGGLPHEGNWPRVREALGWPATKPLETLFDGPIMPEYIEYGSQSVRLAGSDFTGWIYTADLIEPNEITGEVLIQAEVEDIGPIPLLTRQGSYIYLNYNTPHAYFSAVLADLLTPDGFPKPFNTYAPVYMTRGEMTAIMAMEDAQLDINLPFSSRSVRVVEFDDRGNRIRDERRDFANPFTYTLGKWHLVVIDGSAETSVEAEFSVSVPTAAWLDQNYPNPFNLGTLIRYQLPEESHVILQIYDLLGQKVGTLVEGRQEGGWYTIRWDGRDDGGADLASGVYLCRIRAGDFVKVQKMALIR